MIDNDMIIVRDDLGYAWYFADGRITCVGDDTPNGGYACESLEAGVRILNELEYLTLGEI